MSKIFSEALSSYEPEIKGLERLARIKYFIGKYFPYLVVGSGSANPSGGCVPIIYSDLDNFAESLD